MARLSYEQPPLPGEEEDPSIFTDSLIRGLDSTQGMLYASAGALGDLFGMDTIKEWGMDGFERNLKEAAERPPTIRSWDDVEDFSTFWDYTVEALGENAANILAVLIPGGAAGAVAGKLATTAGKAAAGKALKRKLGDAAYKAATENGKKIAVRRAQIAGAYAASSALGTGETYAQFLDEGVDAPGDAVIAGALKGAVELYGIDKILGLGKVIGRHPVAVVKHALVAAGAESLTETAQTAIDILATKQNKSDFEILSDENIHEIREAFIKGGLVGGVLGGASGTAQAVLGEQNTQPPPVDPIDNGRPPEDGDSPTPESQETIDAQYDAVLNETSTKDVMEVTEGSPMPSALSDMALVVPTENGMAITFDEDIANRIEEEGGSASLIGDLLYDKPEGKEGTDGTVVSAFDEEGLPVAEMATNEEALADDIQTAEDIAPEGGTVEVTNAEEAINARAALVNDGTSPETTEQYIARTGQVTQLPQGEAPVVESAAVDDGMGNFTGTEVGIVDDLIEDLGGTNQTQSESETAEQRATENGRTGTLEDLSAAFLDSTPVAPVQDTQHQYYNQAIERKDEILTEDPTADVSMVKLAKEKGGGYTISSKPTVISSLDKAKTRARQVQDENPYLEINLRPTETGYQISSRRLPAQLSAESTTVTRDALLGGGGTTASVSTTERVKKGIAEARRMAGIVRRSVEKGTTKRDELGKLLEFTGPDGRPVSLQAMAITTMGMDLNKNEADGSKRGEIQAAYEGYLTGLAQLRTRGYVEAPSNNSIDPRTLFYQRGKNTFNIADAISEVQDTVKPVAKVAEMDRVAGRLDKRIASLKQERDAEEFPGRQSDLTEEIEDLQLASTLAQQDRRTAMAEAKQTPRGAVEGLTQGTGGEGIANEEPISGERRVEKDEELKEPNADRSVKSDPAADRLAIQMERNTAALEVLANRIASGESQAFRKANPNIGPPKPRTPVVKKKNPITAVRKIPKREAAEKKTESKDKNKTNEIKKVPPSFLFGIPATIQRQMQELVSGAMTAQNGQEIIHDTLKKAGIPTEDVAIIHGPEIRPKDRDAILKELEKNGVDGPTTQRTEAEKDRPLVIYTMPTGQFLSQLGLDSTEDTYGLYVENLGIAVIPLNQTEASMRRTVIHEVGVHWGIRRFLTAEQFSDLLAEADALNAPVLNTAIDAAYDADNANPATIAEERLAYVAMHITDFRGTKIYTKIRRYVAQALRRMGVIDRPTRVELEDTIRSLFATEYAQTAPSVQAVGTKDNPLTDGPKVGEVLSGRVINRSAAMIKKLHTGVLKNSVGGFLFTAHGRLKHLAPNIAPLLYQDTHSRNTRDALWTGIESERGVWNGRLNRIIRRYSEHSQQDIDIAFRGLARELPTNQLNGAGKTLRKLIQKYHKDYLAPNLPTIGNTENYFPRLYDYFYIENNTEAFRALLEKHGVLNVEGVIDSLASTTASTGIRENRSFMPQRTTVLQQRQLNDPALIRELVDEGFLNGDPMATLGSYIDSTTKRAEWEKRFGGYQKVRSYTATDKVSAMPPTLQKGRRRANTTTLRRLALENEMYPDRELSVEFADIQQDIKALVRDEAHAKTAAGRAALQVLVNDKARIEKQADRADVKKTLIQMRDFGHLRMSKQNGAEIYDPNAGLRQIILEDSTIDKADYEKVKHLVMSVVETAPVDRNSWHYNLLGTFRAYESLRVLLMAGVASVPEVGSIYARANGEIGAKQYAAVIADTARHYKNHRELAEDIGVIKHGIGAAMWQEMVGPGVGEHGKNRFDPRNMLPIMFKLNGNDFVVNFTKAAATETSKQFMKTVSAKAADGDARSIRYLEELGVSIEAAQSWVSNNFAHPDTLNGNAAVLAWEAQRASLRFVKESVLEPTPGERPTWFSHPLGALVGHLKSYMYAFNKKVLLGMGREIASRQREGDATKLQSFAYIGAATGIFMFFGALSDEIRQRILSFGEYGTYYRSYQNPGRMVGKWVDRSGLNSLPFLDFFPNMDVRSAAFASGPSFSHIYSLFFEDPRGDRDALKKTLWSIPVLSQHYALRRNIYEELEKREAME